MNNPALYMQAKAVLLQTLQTVEEETAAVKSANVEAFQKLQDKKRTTLANLKDVIAAMQASPPRKHEPVRDEIEKLQKKLQKALASNQSVLRAAEDSLKRITDRYVGGLRKALGQETPIYTGKGAREIFTGTTPLSLNLNETI